METRVLLLHALLGELGCEPLEARFVLVFGTTAWSLPRLFGASVVPLVRSGPM